MSMSMSMSTKRNWNWSLWIGFLFVIAAFFSFGFFSQFPITRDFPWVNFLLFGVAGIFLVVGLFRAFGRPQIYRGKIFGSILALLSLLMFTAFAYISLVVVRQVPASAGAPRVGQKAPEFTLSDADGKPVALADLLSMPNTRAAVLIFYRGHW
jgi:hypothetical protein